MYIKYRIFDPSTNIIISTKALGCQYIASSKSKRLPSNKQMIKKIQPSINCQIFQNKHKNERILSKNDRDDLFLSGGNFSEFKRGEKFHSQKAVWIKYNIRNKLKPQLSQTKPHIKKQLSTSLVGLADEGNQIKYITTQKERDYCQKNQNKQLVSLRRAVKSRNKLDNLQNNELARKTSQIQTKIHFGMTQMKSVFKSKPMFYLDQRQLSNITSQSFVVAQYPTRQLILGNYFRKTGQIASLTKIMTFYCVYKLSKEYQKDIDRQMIVIDEFVPQMSGTSAELYQGDEYTVKQLLYGMMLPSGNDAATALAKWGGKLLLSSASDQDKSVKFFISYMNKWAKDLNMRQTKFANPHGLPNNAAISNPQDIAFLIHQCLDIPLFRQVVSCKLFKCTIKNGIYQRQIAWENTNKLLRREGFIGVKTGVTVTAGPCLASCYELNDKIYIVVLLRTTKLSRRFKESRLIIGLTLSKLNYYLHKKSIQKVLKEDRQLDSDNSEDQLEFIYDRKDAAQMAKRNKILTYQL